MYRFYAGSLDLNQSTVEITDKDEIRHISTVLRMKKGDSVLIFNDRRQEGKGTILSVRPEKISLRMEDIHEIDDTGTADVLLACAIPKKTKFEWIIEKCTELGVKAIIPLLTARTEVKLKGERAAKKHQRYQTVAKNAAKQSGRTSLPEIYPLTGFSDAVSAAKEKGYTILIPHLHDRRNPLKDVVESLKTKKAAIFIGPEGDFTPAEVERALAAKAIPVSLGKNVLKVETAAITCAAFTIFSFNS